VKHRPVVKPLDPLEVGEAARIFVEEFLDLNPGVIDAAFAARIEKLAGCLALWGSRMNLTAHPEDPEEVAFHVFDCLMPLMLADDKLSILVDRFAQGRAILDLGSGAGFPGLVLAAASPATFTLVESRRKRVSFLNVAVAEMGLRNVEIEAKRAEDVSPGRGFDLVTARAFGNPAEFFALATGLLKPDGLAMLYANPSQIFGPEVARIPYTVARIGGKVQRILAVCRQPVEEPRGRN
jgi:16S rRNA (guanine527-N7)-methyltransferase